MKTKLLKIIRANFDFWYWPWGGVYQAYSRNIDNPITSKTSFDLIIKMLEQIYPQGQHYAIMRHSRRFKQARHKEAVRVIEVACIVGFAALIIIAILNSCCGTGIQY